MGRLCVENLLAAHGYAGTGSSVLWHEETFEAKGIQLLSLNVDLDLLPANLPDGKLVDLVIHLRLQQ